MKTINSNDLSIVTENTSGLSRAIRPVLFEDRNGDSVKDGDTLEFYVDNEIMPHSGTISNISGLRMECFNTILNKWQYYPVEI